MHSESNSARKLLDGTVSDADRRRSLNGIIPHRAHGGGGGGGRLSPRRVTACGAAHKRLSSSFQRTGPRRGLLYPPASIIVAATLQLAAAVPAGAPAGRFLPARRPVQVVPRADTSPREFGCMGASCAGATR